jgi:hypothetical protein
MKGTSLPNKTQTTSPTQRPSGPVPRIALALPVENIRAPWLMRLTQASVSSATALQSLGLRFRLGDKPASEANSGRWLMIHAAPIEDLTMRSLVLEGNMWATRGQINEHRQSAPVERTSKYSFQSDFAGTKTAAEDMHLRIEATLAH